MEEVLSGSGGAEAVLHLQPTTSISVAYHPLFGPHDDLLLLELDHKLLPDVLHQRVTLRGKPDDEAVLCTQSKTYAVKFVGTSNSAFLIPPSHASTFNQSQLDTTDNNQLVASVIKVAPGSMELVEVAPRLDKLKALLLDNPYFSDDEPKEIEKREKQLYTWDDLVNIVQASDDELMTGLQALFALEIDGYWRVLDEKYKDVILRLLLHNSVLYDWSLDALPENQVLNVLESDGYPKKLALHCLHVYGNKVGEGIWRLEPKRVNVHFARDILRGGKRKMERFLEELMKKIPEGMQSSFDMLEGEVLTEKLGIETWVHAFSVQSLPSTPAERFSMLFKRRPKWEWKDLEPYIRDLNVPGISLEGLLLKYTRRTQPTPDIEPVFCSR